jgi:hypothetical protein
MALSGLCLSSPSRAIDRLPQSSTSDVLSVHGATGCPQVIHNLCKRRWSLSGRMVGRLPGACAGAEKQAHRAERFTASSGFA